MIDLHVTEAKPSDAPALLGIIHTAFGARPPLDPPGTALQETLGSIEAAVEAYGGLLARVDDLPAGAILFAEDGGWLVLRRVSVHPRFQHRGVATAMVGCAEEVAETRGMDGVRLVARAELPSTLAFWWHRGYVELARRGPEVDVVKRLPVEVMAPSAGDTRAVGERLAGLLRAGDLVLLTGELGAGKTTLTQGIGAGLRVRGDVTSPTFVIARGHQSLAGGPSLVHVDAYRLGGVPELDDLDLDTSLDESVTVVEWGEGLAEGLAEDRLDVVLTRSLGDPAGGVLEGWPGGAADEGAGGGTETRRIRIVPAGRRWVDVPLRAALGAPPT
ncbi:tRNA (adenosine(37)-N6)-threonylcarbamoyltransferase complex ATPase subunit type 1 TsaE [Actinopolymorpha sp. B17G11]|uniref:tRNA (adenosine(37)-N6)-threonylcarbamoyltransferase complex ATPase subunit type 1 TsaE n=1 Tax=unclassified Actinopolymorpha TaxID=2627063 RepID=UPI0032D91C51